MGSHDSWDRADCACLLLENAPLVAVGSWALRVEAEVETRGPLQRPLGEKSLQGWRSGWIPEYVLVEVTPGLIS